MYSVHNSYVRGGQCLPVHHSANALLSSYKTQLLPKLLLVIVRRNSLSEDKFTNTSTDSNFTAGQIEKYTNADSTSATGMVILRRQFSNSLSQDKLKNTDSTSAAGHNCDAMRDENIIIPQPWCCHTFACAHSQRCIFVFILSWLCVVCSPDNHLSRDRHADRQEKVCTYMHAHRLLCVFISTGRACEQEKYTHTSGIRTRVCKFFWTLMLSCI